MTTLNLVHWNAAEAAERAAQLRAAGYTVTTGTFDGAGLRALRADPPAAFVIDLSRLPSHGRSVAFVLRQTRATRHVPLVFADGAAEKVAAVRALFPDAVFTAWTRIRTDLKRALAAPPIDPVVPRSRSGPSGVPLPRKLGLKPGAVVGLIDAPDEFERTLGPLPDGVRLRRGPRTRCDLVVWFARSRAALARRAAGAARLAGDGGLWVAWPKKASGLATDLSDAVVREVLLGVGLVDFKVCAIDATWSGLRFGRRRPPAARR